MIYKCEFCGREYFGVNKARRCEKECWKDIDIHDRRNLEETFIAFMYPRIKRFYQSKGVRERKDACHEGWSSDMREMLKIMEIELENIDLLDNEQCARMMELLAKLFWTLWS